MKDKIFLCDCAKAVAMLAVIAHHAAAYYMPGGWFNSAPAENSFALGFFAAWLNTFHVFVFTFVSGYIFQYLKFECGRYETFGGLLKKKFFRLLVPYILVAAAWCAPFHEYFFHATAAELFRKFVLGYSPAQLWYVLMLFFVFAMVFPIAKKIQSLSTPKVICAAAAIYFFGLGLQIFSPPFELAEAVRQSAFFILGMNFRKTSPPLRAWYFYAAAHLILFVAFYQLLLESSPLFKAIRYSLQPILSLLGIFMVIAFIQEHLDADFWRTKIFSLFAANSFTIYLFHQQIIYCVIARFDGVLPPPILFAANFVAAIFFSGIICLVLKKFSNALARIRHS